MPDLSSQELVALTQELHAMWVRLNEIVTGFPNGDLKRAGEDVGRSFPKFFMELRDQIGCAVLREARGADAEANK
jgi:hypothetical protein